MQCKSPQKAQTKTNASTSPFFTKNAFLPSNQSLAISPTKQQIQREDDPKGKRPKRKTKYTYTNFDDARMSQFEASLFKAYQMTHNAAKFIQSLRLEIARLMALKKKPAEVVKSIPALSAFVDEFIVGDVSTFNKIESALMEIYVKYNELKAVIKRDKTIKYDPDLKPVAQAHIKGDHITVGKRFFTEWGAGAFERPRVLIHEFGHNYGITADCCGSVGVEAFAVYAARVETGKFKKAAKAFKDTE